MSDQERKGKSGGDERERSEESESSEAETSEENEGSETETPDQAAGDADTDETDGEKEADEDADPGEGEENARAQRVAAALGVGAESEEGEGTAAEDEPAAPPNRAARRAEAAQRRKKRKTAAASSERSAEDEPDAPLPRDKNARAKELLKRRREQASGEGTRPVQLLPGEMVDDALARSSSAVSKWIRDNFSILQWVILGALASGVGFLVYETRADKSAAGATAELMAGVDADRGRVMAEDKRTAEEKEGDPTKVFKTSDERADTALAGYKKVLVDHAGTGAAILARLGEAGDYLDKREWDHALEGFSAVSSSTLAGADPDVKVRALEGIGFAREGKGDLDGALAAFKEVESVDGRGNKELGLYHQGRVWLAKGDKDKAKDFLKQAHDKLEQPTPESQAFRFLQQMTDETLRRIDPSLVQAKGPTVGGPKGSSVTSDEIEKLKRKLEETMRNKGGEQH